MTRLMLVTLVLALALGLAAGCKKKQQGSTQTAGGPATEQAAPPRVSSTENATGDLRDLLLELERVHFAFDGSELVPAAREALDKAGRGLMAHADVVLYVDGNTDERGTGEYNMGLGDRRARTVVNYLTSLGVSKENLRITSFGEENPLAAGGSELAMAKNRRVDFRLIRGDVQLVLGEGTPIDDQGQPLE
ncbi:MAG TPA: OmpA family protein [Polyangia bacterium]|nr:OmpA family protein [Polyangia bacterium]